MIQVRKGVFETNSSSTHSIAIPRNCSSTIGRIYFQIGEFGWGWESVDPADYFYTAIYEVSETLAEVDEKISQLKDILNYHDIEFDFENVECEENDGWLSFDGYIDHGGELREFVDELLNDGDKLVRFLSGGCVFTGNDNSESNGFITRNEEFIEHYDWRSRTYYREKNPYYMNNCDDYEWHYKGN
jgi:hypothetical protein